MTRHELTVQISFTFVSTTAIEVDFRNVKLIYKTFTAAPYDTPNIKINVS